MGTLKEEATNYTPTQKLNVSELKELDLNIVLLDGEGTDTVGKKYYYKYFEKDGNEYRVPNIVLEKIQDILKLKPSVTKVKVTKTGSGLGTKYKVDALD